MTDFASEHLWPQCADYLTWLALHGHEVLTAESADEVDRHWKEVHGR